MTPTTPRLSPQMFRARIACLVAQAYLDALNKDPADRAWAQVMDAFYAWVCEVPPQLRS